MAFYMLVLLITIDIAVNVVGHIKNHEAIKWLHDVFTPFMASLPEGIKANGKGVSW